MLYDKEGQHKVSDDHQEGGRRMAVTQYKQEQNRVSKCIVLGSRPQSNH